MHESPGWKPDWCLNNRFLSSKKLKSLLKIIFLRYLLNIERRDTGRWFDAICLSFLIWIRTIFALFHWVANIPAAREFWNIKVSGWATDLMQSLIILTEILSWPCGLFTSKDPIFLITSGSLKDTEWMRSSVMYVNSLLFETGWHCFAKKEVQIFAFCWKSVTNQLKEQTRYCRNFVTIEERFNYCCTACRQII